MTTLNNIIWSIGLIAIILAAGLGLAEGGLWLIDRIIKAAGLYHTFWQVIQRMYRERVERNECEFVDKNEPGVS